MLGSILAHFWYHFGVTLGSLGGGPPPSLPSEKGVDFGTPFWNHFGVHLGTPLGPSGDPRRPQEAQKRSKGSPKRGLDRGPKRDPKNDSILDPPWRCSGELSPTREHRFHYFSWLTFGPHFGSILGPLWDPRGPLFSPRGPRRGTEGVQKGVPKRGRFLTPLFEPKRTPKWLL